ncbi:MAG: primase C-terminal domain-containing protein [Candidatus Heimdallarchaeaceae archaeon]|jgi:hypothetical protein
MIEGKNVPNFYGKTDYFISAARYDDSVVNYMKEHNNKIGGFNGNAWYDWVIIDVDEMSSQKVSIFMQSLEVNYGIEINFCRIYFSGRKGFHILIPSTIFGFKPGLFVNGTIKRIVASLTENLIDYDHSMYDKNQVYRLQNTLHSQSQLYKIPIEYNELSKGNGYIKEKAKFQRLDFDYPEYPTKEIPELVEFAKEIPHKKEEDVYRVENDGLDYDKIPPFSKLCILHMLKGVNEGQREETAFRIAAHFRKQGYPFDVVIGMLDGWNNLNKPPLTKMEIREKALNVFKSNYDYGCRDGIMAINCDSHCFLFKKGK